MNKKFLNYFAIVMLLLLWELLVIIKNIPTYLFPSPSGIFTVFLNNYQLLLGNWVFTIMEAICGFVLANVISITIAILSFRVKYLENIILPYAITLKTVPIISLTPLLILWFGSGFASRIIAVMLICFFPSLVNMLRGVSMIDANWVNLFKIYSATSSQMIRLLVIPATLPYLFSALKISSSLAVVGALISEFITANRGLGYIIITGYYTLDISLVFAAIIMSSLSGIAFYLIINYMESRLSSWDNSIE